jgi:GNAT superfamily N-acetyltransferase
VTDAADEAAGSGAVRPAVPGDVPVILELVRDLAIYEREPDAVRMTAAQLADALFGPVPAAHCHVAIEDGGTDHGGTDGDGTDRAGTDRAGIDGDGASATDADAGAAGAADEGRVVGFALWFITFSTWTGQRGLYLEDLFVRTDARGRGHGLALMRALAATCVERGYPRFEWSVLDWNTPSIGFYRSIGALATDEWTRYRLSGPALGILAAGAPSVPSTRPAGDRIARSVDG